MNQDTVLYQPPEKIPWVQVFILTAGLFMAFMDMSIVNIAMPKLMSFFGVSLNTIQWLVNAYLLSSGVTIAFVGYLSDRLGIKTAFLLAVGIFTAGSAICSVATDLNLLIAARVIQAVGGGAMMPISTTYIYHLVRREKMGQALGIRSIAVVAAPAFGPALGGLIIQNLDWHMIFAINLPIGILTILLGMVLLPRVASHGKPHLDLVGMTLLAGGAFCVLLALSRGQSLGWGSLSIVAEFTGGAFALIIFILWELAAEKPVFDLRVFQGNATLSASFGGIVVMTIALNGSFLLLPVFAQQILGFSALQTGLLMTPAALVMGVITPIAGRLFDRIGPIPLVVTGVILGAAFTFQMTYLATDTPYRVVELWNAERAGGFAMLMMPITVAGLNTVSQQVMSRVTALQSLLRSVSGSLGTAFMTYLYVHQQVVYADTFSTKVSPSSPGVAAFLHAHAGHRLLALSAVKMELAFRATASSLDYTMIVCGIIILAVLPLAFLLHPPKTPPRGAPAAPGRPAAEAR